MIDLLAADPIVAQATPAGAGAVGIIRVSGAGASAIVGSLLGPADRGLWEAQPTRILQLYTLHDPATGAALDEALVVRFVAPHSFTGEEVVEIQGHGSPVVMDAVVQACVKAGARLAERGEFSYRAFRNGKLDLSEAEGLQALASATGQLSAAGGLGLLQGGLRREVESLRRDLTDTLAQLEVAFDYPEDHESGYDRAAIAEQVSLLGGRLASLVRSYEAQQTLVEGIKVVLVGAPNAGKSSLLNALVGINRALVHATPGTTRDVVEAQVVHGGHRFVIYDTAGGRAGGGEIEAAGIALAREYVDRADVLVHVLDRSAIPSEVDADLVALRPEAARLTVLSKADLPPNPSLDDWLTLAGIDDVRPVSALSGEGLEEFRRALLEIAEPLAAQQASGPGHYLTQRQYSLFHEALGECDRALVAVAQNQPEDIVALHLREVLESLLRITGEVYDETVLQAIFSQFCVGK